MAKAGDCGINKPSEIANSKYCIYCNQNLTRILPTYQPDETKQRRKRPAECKNEAEVNNVGELFRYIDVSEVGVGMSECCFAKTAPLRHVTPSCNETKVYFGVNGDCQGNKN